MNTADIKPRMLMGPGPSDVNPRLLEAHGIEIGGGLGAYKGKAWRIGLMGESATRRHVQACLTALGEALADLGKLDDRAAGWAAAQAAYGK